MPPWFGASLPFVYGSGSGPCTSRRPRWLRGRVESGVALLGEHEPEPGNQVFGVNPRGRSRSGGRGRGVGRSLRPNPSAHLVGVEQRGDRPLVLHGRKRTSAVLATLVALLTALVTIGIGIAAPSATAKPDLKSVKKQVQKLDQQAEAASERFNDARVK